MQRVSDIHGIVARIGLLGMPSQAHHELPQRKNQRLVQAQHRVVFKRGGRNPLERLPFFPGRITCPLLTGEEEEYEMSIDSKGDGVGLGDNDAKLFFQFTTERYQGCLTLIDLPTRELPRASAGLPLWSLLNQYLAPWQRAHATTMVAAHRDRRHEAAAPIGITLHDKMACSSRTSGFDASFCLILTE